MLKDSVMVVSGLDMFLDPWRMFPHRSGQNLWRGERPIDWSWMKMFATGPGLKQRSHVGICRPCHFSMADEGNGFDMI